MKIAILAWGSLVWDPRELQTAAKFAADGPLLPIEFCRISADGRLHARDRRRLRRDLQDLFGVKWARQSRCGDREPSSQRRDGARAGGRLCRNGLRQAKRFRGAKPSPGCRDDRRLGRVAGYDAAIWTALKSNFADWGKGGEPFSVTAALQYLEALEKEDAAKFAQAHAYIRNAPPEVETPVRDEVARRWPH